MPGWVGAQATRRWASRTDTDRTAAFGARKTRAMAFAVLGLAWLAGSITAHADSAQLLRIRTAAWEDRYRVVMDLDRPCDYEHKTYIAPHRVAINLIGATAPGLDLPAVDDPLLHRIRFNALSGPKAQVVLDLSAGYDYRTFTVPATAEKPFRVVCDVLRASPVDDQPPDRSWTVIIDPGHGGYDPGAVEKSLGLFEKEIVLDVSRRLKKELSRARNVEVHLTRSGDQPVKLSERIAVAHEVGADIFVSIHVNGCAYRSARGAEVFYLSLQGATSAASRELEALENSAETIEADPHLGDIAGLPFAVDLIQTDTLLRSSLLAEVILDALGESRLAAARGVKQANFAVLRSCRVPSALVELGFITNPEDARQLASSAHRQALAETIARGLLDYRHDYARQVGTLSEIER